MPGKILLCIFFSILTATTVKGQTGTGDISSLSQMQIENFATKFILRNEMRLQNECNKKALGDWLYATNLTEENEAANLNSTIRYARQMKRFWKTLMRYPWNSFENRTLYRFFRLKSNLGESILPVHQWREFTKNLNAMKKIYGDARVCHFRYKKRCNLTIDGYLTRAMAYSRNTEELLYYWKEWREKTGFEMRAKFPRYVHLANVAAHMNGFADMGELWVEGYESDFFKQDIHALWGQVKPLYQELHAYVREKLRLFYGDEKVSADGMIPAHLLGNMWGQIWTG